MDYYLLYPNPSPEKEEKTIHELGTSHRPTRGIPSKPACPYGCSVDDVIAFSAFQGPRTSSILQRQRGLLGLRSKYDIFQFFVSKKYWLWYFTTSAMTISFINGDILTFFRILKYFINEAIHYVSRTSLELPGSPEPFYTPVPQIWLPVFQNHKSQSII